MAQLTVWCSSPTTIEHGESSIVPVKVTVPVLLPAALAKLETPITSAAATAALLLYSFSSLLKVGEYFYAIHTELYSIPHVYISRYILYDEL